MLIILAHLTDLLCQRVNAELTRTSLLRHSAGAIIRSPMVSDVNIRDLPALIFQIGYDLRNSLHA